MEQHFALLEERTKIREKINTLLASLSKNHTLTADGVIDLVYKAGTTWGDKAHLQFQKEIMHRLGKNAESESAFPVLELAFECWNHFPHQDMNDKCPFELIQEADPKITSETHQEPQIIVGEQSMSMEEYEAMIAKMEIVQKPFREWLLDGILPAYKHYLTEVYQTKTVKKHYAVAEILCERLLHVGFTSPLHIRPEFLYDEFPVWWQTHVMFGNYTETMVENSVMEFISFVEDAAGVSLDNGEVATDINLWRE